jgi:hypothetical protein
MSTWMVRSCPWLTNIFAKTYHGHSQQCCYIPPDLVFNVKAHPVQL